MNACNLIHLSQKLKLAQLLPRDDLLFSSPNSKIQIRYSEHYCVHLYFKL